MRAAVLHELEDAAEERPSYLQILRSSALIGGASALGLIIGIVRTKVLAVLLGPTGIGLLGVFTSIFDLARSVAQLGIQASGVRQIAEATATADSARIARTVIVLRRVALVLGLLGTLSLAALSGPVSQWVFSSDQHVMSIAWLSIAVFFRLIADGQAALFQGMRRISQLARLGVYGALAGALVSIVLAATFGEKGVVPGLVASAAVATLISWAYARTVKVEPPPMSAADFRQEALSLLKLGSAFMASALLMSGAAFAVRAVISRHIGLEGAGLYQAAWTLGGVYVGLVMQAMGTDFYPRLVGVIDDRVHSNRIVNEQARVSLLLAGPGVVATLVFAEPVVHAFYSADFVAAIETLRWISLGMALRVITWPLGYIIVAKNRRLMFFVAELAWTIVNVALSVVLVQRFGLDGAGIAFFLSYVFHALLVYPMAQHLSGFRWSGDNVRIGIAFVGTIACTWVGMRWLPANLGLALGIVITLSVSLWSASSLMKLVNVNQSPRWLRRMLSPRRNAIARNPKDQS
jgi:PST family polysaccharide transporter